MKNLKRPKAIISLDLARSIGCDCANEWLRGGDNPLILNEHNAWRASCLADLVQNIRHQRDFMAVMVEWEYGFDSTLAAATGDEQGTDSTMNAATTATGAATETRHDMISRLAGRANTVAALLSVIELLPIDAQQDAIATCASIAEDVAGDLAALARGAA
jgi:hypothetical protein